MTDPTWPAPWTLKPTHDDPRSMSDIYEGDESITWDLSFGFTLNVTPPTEEDNALTIGAHFSDADLARGFVKREVTPDQLDTFARLLLDVAAKQRTGVTR